MITAVLKINGKVSSYMINTHTHAKNRLSIRYRNLYHQHSWKETQNLVEVTPSSLMVYDLAAYGEFWSSCSIEIIQMNENSVCYLVLTQTSTFENSTSIFPGLSYKTYSCCITPDKMCRYMRLNISARDQNLDAVKL